MLGDIWRRRKAKSSLEKVSDPVMREYLQAYYSGPPTLTNEVEYLALDLEMSGLNANHDHILSFGYLPIIDFEIDLQQAEHQLIAQQNVDLSETAPIHQIRDVDLTAGGELSHAFEQMLRALTGRILVLHHAPLDFAFLNRACQSLYGIEFYTHCIDTMEVERKRPHVQHSSAANKLRLHDCRQRYNLPNYRAHNAVVDALSTAELWLAQLSHISAGKAVKLKSFLR